MTRAKMPQKVKLLEKVVGEAEMDDEVEGALRRRNDAQEEWVLSCFGSAFANNKITDWTISI